MAHQASRSSFSAGTAELPYRGRRIPSASRRGRAIRGLFASSIVFAVLQCVFLLTPMGSRLSFGLGASLFALWVLLPRERYLLVSMQLAIAFQVVVAAFGFSEGGSAGKAFEVLLLAGSALAPFLALAHLRQHVRPIDTWYRNRGMDGWCLRMAGLFALGVAVLQYEAPQMQPISNPTVFRAAEDPLEAVIEPEPQPEINAPAPSSPEPPSYSYTTQKPVPRFSKN